MKCMILAILLSLTSIGFTQNRSYTTAKNLISGEFGMFHRGLIGVSYLRMVVNQDRVHIGGGGGAGIGGVPGTGAVNQFYYVTVCASGGGLDIGRNEFIFMGATIDLQYINYHDIEYETTGNQTWPYPVHFELFRVMPYVNLTFMPEEDVTIQMRFPLMALFVSDDRSAEEWGGVGISAGYLF